MKTAEIVFHGDLRIAAERHNGTWQSFHAQEVAVTERGLLWITTKSGQHTVLAHGTWAGFSIEQEAGK